MLRVPSTCCSTARPADHRRTRRRDSDVAASSESARRHPGGGRPALGLDGPGRQQRRVGQRGRCAISARQVQLVRDAGALAAAAALPLRLGPSIGVDRATSRLPPRSSRRPTAWRRRPGAASRPFAAAEAPGAARKGSRGLRACDSSKPRPEGQARRLRALGGRGPVQRPGPLRGGGVGGPASHVEHLRVLGVCVGAARAGRGGHARGRRRARTRCARAARGDDPARRHRLRARHRGALTGAAERRRRRRRPVSRSDRAVEPYAAASGARPRASALWGVAAPRGPTRRRARAAAHRPPPVRRDRHGGVRRARPPRAAGDRREGAQAQPPARARSSRRRRSRSPGSLATAFRTRRSARSCSSARARSSGTCATCSPSSASPRAGSSERRCPRTAGSPAPAPSVRSAAMSPWLKHRVTSVTTTVFRVAAAE